MKERGFQNKELYITEMGVLPRTCRGPAGVCPRSGAALYVQHLRMDATATDPNTGCPADGYRLVQRWVWFAWT